MRVESIEYEDQVFILKGTSFRFTDLRLYEPWAKVKTRAVGTQLWYQVTFS